MVGLVIQRWKDFHLVSSGSRFDCSGSTLAPIRSDSHDSSFRYLTSFTLVVRNSSNVCRTERKGGEYDQKRESNFHENEQVLFFKGVFGLFEYLSRNDNKTFAVSLFDYFNCLAYPIASSSLRKVKCWS